MFLAMVSQSGLHYQSILGVCVLDTCHAPLHILSRDSYCSPLLRHRVPWGLHTASPGCESDSVSPVPSSHTSHIRSQVFSYARRNIPRGIMALPHRNPDVRGSVTPWATPWPIDDRSQWIHSSLFCLPGRDFWDAIRKAPQNVPVR